MSSGELLAARMAATDPPRSSNLWHLALAAFWFGNFFLWQPLTTVVIQGQVDALVSRTTEQNTAIGLAIGVGGFFAMVVPPLVGAFSDRLTSPWGRRRPIMVAGTVLALPGLALMATAQSFTQLVIGYGVLQFFFAAAGAAFAGIIPDVVPEREFGRASGYLAAMVLVGSAAGLVASTILGSSPLIYLAFGVVMLLTLIPTTLAARGEGQVAVAAGPSEPLGVRLRGFFRPLWGGDFAWVLYTRLLVSAAITAIAYYLFNFFRDVTRVADPHQFTSIWFLVVLAAAVPLGLAGGYLSDRLGRRKLFVYLSGGFQVFVMLVFVILYPTATALVLGLGVAYGVGYGLYYSVDWALACDTLPDRSKAAKDMGLFHVALTLPQFLVPITFGKLLDYFNGLSPNSGYRFLLISSMVFLALGTVFVSRVRSVR